MQTHYSLFSRSSFLRKPYTNSLHSKHRGGCTLADYSVMVAIVFLLTLLFTPLQVFAATMQKQGHEKMILPLNWSCGDPNTGHCYGAQYWGGANGADTRISLNNSLNGGGSSNDLYNYSFVTTEMWLDSTNYTYWVEGGIISEYAYTQETFPFYFWADNRPNGGGFSFHYLAREAYSSGTLLTRITRSGSSSWNVLLQDGQNSFTGLSTANNISIQAIQIGTELHNNYQTAYEPNIYYTNNRWLNSSGNFQYQTNDGIRTNIMYPIKAGWFQNQDPLHSSTGGVWYTCIPGYGC